jgi:hypothetical protein
MKIINLSFNQKTKFSGKLPKKGFQHYFIIEKKYVEIIHCR